jgi:hypothetical protein
VVSPIHSESAEREEEDGNEDRDRALYYRYLRICHGKSCPASEWARYETTAGSVTARDI